MEVMPGYKHTSVGVIPEEWSIKPLFEIAELTSSKRIFESDYVPFGIPFYRGKEISMLIKAEVIDDPCFITEKRFNEIKIKFGAPVRGDILITAVGTLANVYVVNSDYPFYFKDGNLIWLRYIKDVEAPFLGIQLAWRRSAILDGAIGSSQKALTIEALNYLKVAIPSPKEQQAISMALNDIDALLNSLDRLIAKKRDLKQAAMQQLLSGQTRLPGFSEKWNQCQVQDVVSGFFCGPSPTCEERNIQNDEWGVLKTTATTKEKGWDWTKHKTLPRAFWNKFHLELQAGDVIVTKAGPRHRVGVASWVDYVPPRIIVSGKMIGLRPRSDRVVALMLSAAISATETQAYIDQRTTGMAESQVNFENRALLEAPIKIPRLEEQIAIAQVLGEMDAELIALGDRRNKTAALKQGMMQELLTGRTRLV